MKPLFVILAICAAGYLANHWEDIHEQHTFFPTPHLPGLIIYGRKSSSECVQLQGELTKRGIAFQKRDLDNEANERELAEKLGNVNRAGGNIIKPVAEIDGVLVTNATIEQVLRRLK